MKGLSPEAAMLHSCLLLKDRRKDEEDTGTVGLKKGREDHVDPREPIAGLEEISTLGPISLKLRGTGF